MKIDRLKLREALTIVKPGLSSKEILEQTTSFAFKGERVITYNDEISISHEVKGIGLEGALKAEELYGLLTKLTHEEINLEVEGDELKISCGRTKAGLHLEEEINLPLQDVPDKWKEIKSPEKFAEYLQLAAQICSRDMSQPKLTCVCVREGTVLGSDGNRLIQCTLEEELPVGDFLIPATSVVEMVKIIPTHIQLEDDWIHFKNGNGTIFSCRRIDDTYIEQSLIDTILNVKGKAVISFPNKILALMERVMPFAKRDFVMDEEVEIVVKDSKATIKAEALNTGSWIKEKISLKCDKDVSFKITPTLFIDILHKTKICHVDKSLQKGKFTLKNEWDYIVMFRIKK